MQINDRTSRMRTLWTYKPLQKKTRNLGFENLTALVMKGYTFCNTKLRNPLKVDRRVWWNVFALWYLIYYWAYSSTLKMEETFPPKRRLTSNGLHGFIYQMAELFKKLTRRSKWSFPMEIWTQDLSVREAQDTVRNILRVHPLGAILN
jgi:hypothetical protein